jgi:hypothetical protein
VRDGRDPDASADERGVSAPDGGCARSTPSRETALEAGRLLLNYVLSDPYADVALVGDDIESQAHQALTNLGRVLEAAGSSWDKVIKVNCVLVRTKRNFAGWNRVFKTFVRGGYTIRDFCNVHLHMRRTRVISATESRIKSQVSDGTVI